VKDIKELLKRSFMKKQKSRIFLKLVCFSFSLVVVFFACQNNNVEKTYYSNGELKEEFLVKNSLKNGYYKEFYDDGALKFSANYKNDTLHGLSKAYFPNGNIDWEVEYKKGQYHGKFTDYNENGQILSTTNFNKGKQHGIMTDYYLDGSVKLINEYINDTLNGEVREYSKEFRNLYIKLPSNPIAKGEEFKIIPTFYIDDLKNQEIEWFYTLNFPSGEYKSEHIIGNDSYLELGFTAKEVGVFSFEVDVTHGTENYYRDTTFTIKDR